MVRWSACYVLRHRVTALDLKVETPGTDMASVSIFFCSACVVCPDDLLKSRFMNLYL